MRTTNTPSPSLHYEAAIRPTSGNAFLFVLLGVFLLAALAFTFSRGAQQGIGSVHKKSAVLAASEIIDYASLVERTVQKMLRRPMSENDLSFAYAPTFFYAHGPAQPNENRVFDPAGGNIPYMEPSTTMLDTSFSASPQYAEWLFWSKLQVENVGTTGIDELIMALQYVDENVCIAINSKLGISNPSGTPPVEAADAPVNFTGTYDSSGALPIGDEAGNALDGQQTGCYYNGSHNVFYRVLLER